MDHRESLSAFRQLAAIRSFKPPKTNVSSVIDVVPQSVEMMLQTAIERANTMAKAVFVLAEEIDAGLDRDEDQTAARRRADSLMDDLIGFLLASFPCTVREEEQDRLVLAVFEQTDHLDTLNADFLARLNAAVIPYAMVRELCHRYPRALCPPAWKTLPAFSARFAKSVAKANEYLCPRMLARLEETDKSSVAVI